MADRGDEGRRADARANRNHILEVAREAFAQDPGASLNSIAKASGVGAGTLYRHFPSREALILAVYRKEIQALVDLAPVLLKEHTPLEAFRRWCDRLADYGRVKSGLSDVIHATITDVDFQETYWPMVRAVEAFLRAGEASGEFRSGVDAEDLLLLLGFLWRAKPGESGETQVANLVALVIDGLRSH